MAQLVARLVRNEKVGGSNPPSSTTGRHPIADVGFLCAWARWCGALLPLVFWAPHVLSPGPGCWLCPWAAARPLAVRAASFARRVVSKPGQAPPPSTGTAVPSGTLHSRLLSLTGAAGDSRETVIAFAGVCSVSGETDDTIAGQIPPFSAQFWRAKASWVSWRRPEVPALVLTVSYRGAVSSMGARKFAQRSRSMTIARKYSPSAGKMAQNECFMACWASFFAEMAHMTSCWASFSRKWRIWPRVGRVFSHPPAP